MNVRLYVASVRQLHTGDRLHEDHLNANNLYERRHEGDSKEASMADRVVTSGITIAIRVFLPIAVVIVCTTGISGAGETAALSDGEEAPCPIGTARTPRLSSIGLVAPDALPSMAAGPSSDEIVTKTFGSSGVEVERCYREDTTQTMCFTVFNGGTSVWVDRVQLTFPTLDGNWSVACNPSLEDPTDSVGYTVNFNCTTPLVNQVVYLTADSDGLGEISGGASWNTCVDVTVPASYSGNRFIPWELRGDDGAGVSSSIMIENCTPLTLTPSSVDIEGCNGAPQFLEFELWNYSAGDVMVDFSYETAYAEFTGPASSFLAQGNSMILTATLIPDATLCAGELVTATLTANGAGNIDSAAVTETITETGGWHRVKDSPVPSMDNVVVWASHRDGGLWSIGGYESNGATQRYDPVTDTWTTGQAESVLGDPIEYAMDGCYGLDGPNPDTAHEIVVLFPDTITTGALHVYDITDNSWSTRAIPGFFPPGFKGRWGFDVVSLLNNPSVKPGITNRNICYLSGGADQEGGGRVRDLWIYDPATNGGAYLGNFSASIWFGFHASWYVPWVGNDGAICVAGGVDHNHQINNSSQCYDIAGASFNSVNADLGTLPEPWWGMADGWQVGPDGHELWLANGVAQDGTLLPISAFIREGMVNFQQGPGVPDAMYRLEGDGYDGRFFTLNGARGGFIYSEFSLGLESCHPCGLFIDGFESGDTSSWSLSIP
jgi:hypothetical protein